METIKIIFLDIDGVLNNEDFYIQRSIEGGLFVDHANKPYPLCEFDPRCVDNINQIVERTNAKIVLSSSWRIDDTESLQNIFSNVGLPPIYGKTPFIMDFNPCTQYMRKIPRGEEIQQYLDNTKDSVLSYVIIDDDTDMLSNQKHCFVRCDERFGLSKNKMRKAIKILNKYEK